MTKRKSNDIKVVAFLLPLTQDLLLPIETAARFLQQFGIQAGQIFLEKTISADAIKVRKKDNGIYISLTRSSFHGCIAGPGHIHSFCNLLLAKILENPKHPQILRHADVNWTRS